MGKEPDGWEDKDGTGVALVNTAFDVESERRVASADELPEPSILELASGNETGASEGVSCSLASPEGRAVTELERLAAIAEELPEPPVFELTTGNESDVSEDVSCSLVPRAAIVSVTEPD